ncbi:hypothetical protein OOK58_47465 [Streptomyces sp. NBC_01728]|uniref:hypothetical protein n=1 Tax=unclassified Streptomyces TaxID=2593676 RepID=UPI002258FEB1|nr:MULTISPECIES: hypothetical protein [unclassified Streptomyces]MCX4459498.1 hypothetical protein [Streptomyces sp. NBC_01719]MCX4498856.1 hypothetical protein [Streptomyces sp. NBC_01728]
MAATLAAYAVVQTAVPPWVRPQIAASVDATLSFARAKLVNIGIDAARDPNRPSTPPANLLPCPRRSPTAHPCRTVLPPSPRSATGNRSLAGSKATSGRFNGWV